MVLALALALALAPLLALALVLRCGRVAAEFDLGLSLTSKRIMSISLGSGMFFTTPLSLHKHKILPGFMLGLARAQSHVGDNHDSTLAT